MKKEIYKIECPKRIVIGDPLYFENYEGKKLQSLVVDYKPPQNFTARLVLLEKKSEEFDDFMERSMELYFAPDKTMQTYMDGMKYEAQEEKEKLIGVDTAQYIFTVNDRSDVIRTGGDGYWGSEIELYRQINGHKVTDAMLLSVYIPDDRDFNDMRKIAHYFFPDMKQVNKVIRKNRKEAER